MKSAERFEYRTEAFFEGGKTLDGSRAPSFVEWLNDQGSRGWRLVSVAERPTASYPLTREHFCVLERRVEERPSSDKYGRPHDEGLHAARAKMRSNT